MSRIRNYRTLNYPAFFRGTACIAALAALTVSAASAQTFELVYTGTFSSADSLGLPGSTASPFADSTPFLITAFFNENSPNLAPPPFPGFKAYSPTSAAITVSGQTYQFATYDQNPLQGVTVAIFDTTTPFGAPGHSAVGLLQNPLADGAGIIGDFASTSVPFSAANLVPMVFTGYTGVGYGSGPGNPSTVVPMPLSDASGTAYALTLGNYDEEFAGGGVQNTAVILAVPVPEASSTVSLGLLLVLGTGGAAFARRKARTYS